MFNEEGFNVIDLEVPPADDQVGGDVIEAAQKVRFSIKKAGLRQNEKKTISSLNFQAKVGPMGVDGNGKYANKIIFGDVIVAIDEQAYSSDWWKKQARFPWKQLQIALGLDPKESTRINDSFLTSLEGKEFIADIKKADVQEATGEVNEKGKKVYKNTGDFKNELANYKKAE